MDYILIITIIISICFLLYLLNTQEEYLSGFGIVVSILVIANIILFVLIKLYNGRGFFCADLDNKASVDFSFEKKLKKETIDYVKDLKND
tara:strand:+ start:513 stop:782 length:270 start_codon:yes stop_codon:yes gene_type:complete